jgi:hypothetical protein
MHFNTFEINARFYNFPTLRILENRYNKPRGFVYSVKAPKLYAATGFLNPYGQFGGSLPILGLVLNISNDLRNCSSPEMRIEYNLMI